MTFDWDDATTFVPSVRALFTRKTKMRRRKAASGAHGVVLYAVVQVACGNGGTSSLSTTPDASANPNENMDASAFEGADARVADARTTDVPMVDVQPTDVGAVDAGTADVQEADVQTADVQASRDACVLDDAGMTGTGCCANEAVSVPNNDAGNLVRPPGGGLVGNSNYFIAGFPPGSTTGSPITGLDISIAVAQDVPVPNHLDFQLNAWSPQGSNTAWQQYIFDYYNPPGLSGFIDNWPSQGYAEQLDLPMGGDLINFRVSPNPVVALSEGILPAGYTLDIRLQNDSSGNITGVTFSVTDPHCKFASTGVVNLVGLPVDLSGAPLSPMNIKRAAPSPIYALQLNVASQDDVSSGWGTITYSADDLLYAWNGWPPGLEWEGIVTAESSNVRFGEVPSTPSRTITQTFMPPP
jgi:hypothetical protein